MISFPTHPGQKKTSKRSSSLSDERGATAVEYAVMIGLVAVVITVAVAFLGNSLSTGFANAAEGVTSGHADAQAMADQAAAGQAQDDPEALAEQKAAEQAAADEWAAAQEAEAAKLADQAAQTAVADGQDPQEAAALAEEARQQAAEDAQKAAELAAEAQKKADEQAAEAQKKADELAKKIAKCEAKGPGSVWIPSSNGDDGTCRTVKRVRDL